MLVLCASCHPSVSVFITTSALVTVSGGVNKIHEVNRFCMGCSLRGLQVVRTFDDDDIIHVAGKVKATVSISLWYPE